MFGFGRENEEITAAPFLIQALEGEENGIRFVVALPVRGEKGAGVYEAEKPALRSLLRESVPIRADADNRYEISFASYVFHMTRNESFTCWDGYEIRKGKYFILFGRSRLLDCLPNLIATEIARACYPQGWKHYGIYCQNHSIDVIAAEEPEIRKL